MAGLTDWRGTPIELGSIVVYPGRQGSSTWINESEVVEIGTEEDYWTKQPKPFLRVKRLREYHHGTRNQDPKVVKLQRSDQVTVVGKQCGGLDAI